MSGSHYSALILISPGLYHFDSKHIPHTQNMDGAIKYLLLYIAALYIKLFLFPPVLAECGDFFPSSSKRESDHDIMADDEMRFYTNINAQTKTANQHH